MNCCITIALLLLLQSATSSNNIPDDFSFNGYLKMDGAAELGSNGLFTLNNNKRQRYGHAFYNFPIQFKNSSNASVISFSTTFIFAIVPEYPPLSGHGIAFVISPNKEIPGALPSQYLGLFNGTNNGNSSNHILAVELDTITSSEFNDINDNHVGIDINGLNSIESKPAGYFADQNGAFSNLNLISGDPMQVWVEYDGINRQLNVTMSPINIPKPALPLLSLTKDLSPILREYMYVGFSSSTGSVTSNHYILGWSFKMNGQAQQIDVSRLPKLPRSPQVRDDKQIKRILAIALPPIAFLLLLVLIFGFLFMTRMKKFMEVLEDWEVQRPVDRRASPEEVILVDWVFECLERGSILEAVDRQLGTEYAVEEAELVLKLGLLCSHAIAAARPSMSTVMQCLEGRAQLPDNLGDIIKSRDFGEASNEQDVCKFAWKSTDTPLEYLLLQFATSSNNIQDDFTFNGYLKLDGTAELGSNGLFTLTNSSRQEYGHAFYNFPIQFKNSSNASVISFSMTFIFAIVPGYVKLGGHGIAFVMSPNKEIPGRSPSQPISRALQHHNNGNNSNHIVAVELDTVQDFEFDDINDNHVGVDINSLRSIKSAPAGYFADHNGSFRNLSLKSGDPMQIWVEYDSINRQLNVTMSPIHIPKPELPPLSLTKDLSPFLLETLGYIAPELARNGKASASTDLFAFGTFMLEVVCGRRPVNPRASPEEVILVDWVFKCLERGNILEAIDRQRGTEYEVEEAELVLKLGLLCSHAIAAARPSITTVVQYLEGRAQLRDNLGDIIKSRDFGEASNEQDVLPTSIPSLTISEPFTSRGLEPAVFAALVPNRADKPLQELIEEILGDHEMLIFNLDSLQSDRARRCQMQIRYLEDQELNDRSQCCVTDKQVQARPSMSTIVQYLEGRAQVPDNLEDIIKSRDFEEASNEQDVQLPISVTSMTISEPFTSTGR
ncbi:hypothetical protein RHMOL_Rhmol09G0207300 [Rhododendron molle]|uniref:Uncharacterized protein n=1 Tax=Rhododendron molle TaxID=49168 RepID=A0ACC0MFL0_RHOML|nr:hypothetical protein RHMOL_Rhmol09G0207300 [Rhododendron molle]